MMIKAFWTIYNNKKLSPKILWNHFISFQWLKCKQTVQRKRQIIACSFRPNRLNLNSDHLQLIIYQFTLESDWNPNDFIIWYTLSCFKILKFRTKTTSIQWLRMLPIQTHGQHFVNKSRKALKLLSKFKSIRLIKGGDLWVGQRVLRASQWAMWVFFPYSIELLFSSELSIKVLIMKVAN